MKTIIPLLLLFATLGFADPVPAEEPHAEPGSATNVLRLASDVPPDAKRPAPDDIRRAPLKCRVTLCDGSVLHGVLRRRFLPADTETLGRVRLDLSTVESIEFLPASGGAPAGLDRLGPQGTQVQQVQSVQPVHDCRVSFRNGDRLTVRLPADMKPLAFETLLGRMRLPFASVASLAIAGDATEGLLYHCTFDDAASIEHPAKGPDGKFLGGDFVPGKVGNALRTFADEPAAEVDFEPGILGTRGTIEFWAKRETEANDGFADSGNLRFFGLWLHAKGETPPWCSTHFQFTSNDGMGMSGLCGMVNHCSWATNPSFGRWPYDLIRDSLAGWHHYAVTWDAEGLSGTKAPDGGPAVVAVCLDGKPVSTQGRQTISFGGKHLKAIPGFCAKLAFPTPSNGWGSSAGHVPFLIDEFKIWSEPRFSVQP